ncbi:PAS domain-containing protein [Elioraea sp. Yellowstone]|jgi:two-component system nitrogen regulation sensor histidine kinase GlnL|uniref:two-component system sensor histidine kinase NtrB n=1 Tax=Elioraea sp. Yellowstone TaxID=2592070 RepID=UPI0011513168|nr:ATP-binding protein [Elioraea sp. Yellowstone]TQF80995.1 PAS domain-containing protein [Elioraea sp. Yellowstone]
MRPSRSRRALAAARGLAEAPVRLLRAQPDEPDAASILSSLAIAVVVLDRQGRFRSANQAAEQFFAQSAASLAAMRLGDLLPADHPIFAMLVQALDGAAIVADHDMAFESPRIAKHGISVTVAPLADWPDCAVVTLADGSTAQMLDRQIGFRNAARSVSGMAAILAHEVKNPLSGIRGAAQLLEASVPEQDRELARLIQDEADRIRALVDRMDVFSDRPVERRSVNIHEVLEHVRRLAMSGVARHARIVESYDPSLPPVWGNRDQLVQVFLNLVKNAAEAVPEAGGVIELATAFQHGVRLVAGGAGRVHLPLVVSVRDNGPGIDEAIRANLFDPFVTTKRGGSGLGLALVAKLVGDHGGLVECDSRPGRTVFRVHLPVGPAASDDDAP